MTTAEARATSGPLTVVVTALTLVLVSRGVLELVVGKTLAYGVQALAAAAVVVIVLVTGRARPGPAWRRTWTSYYVLVLAAFASGAATLLVSGTTRFFPYIAVMCFICALLAAVSSTTRRVVRVDFGPVVVVTLAVLVAFALLQQLAGFSALPGVDRGSLGDTARPSSLTGSFLHYPLCAAVLTFASAGIAQVRRSRWYAAVAVVGAAAVLLSYSRSGMLVVLAGALLGGVFAPGAGAKLRTAYLALVAALAVYLGFSSTTVVERALSAVSLEGAGNVTRVDRWDLALRMWFDSPLLVGRYTGEVTNVTGNLTDARAIVVESGTLQQLLNFGLVGTVAFYVLAALSVRAVDRRVSWTCAGMTACLIQTFVYQSVEVLPFMALFALVPAMVERPRTAVDPPASVTGPRAALAVGPEVHA